MTDDAAFLSAIQANPNDELARLVYADWLDERGDPRGAYLRAESELSATAKPTETHRLSLRLVSDGVPHDWIAAIARVPIEACRLRFRFECPKRWESLTLTDDPSVRRCGQCCETVKFCTSVVEAQQLAASSFCVAVDASLCWSAPTVRLTAEQIGQLRTVTMGRLLTHRPTSPIHETPLETEQREDEDRADEAQQTTRKRQRARRAYKRQSPGTNSTTNPDAP